MTISSSIQTKVKTFTQLSKTLYQQSGKLYTTSYNHLKWFRKSKGYHYNQYHPTDFYVNYILEHLDTQDLTITRKANELQHLTTQIEMAETQLSNQIEETRLFDLNQLLEAIINVDPVSLQYLHNYTLLLNNMPTLFANLETWRVKHRHLITTLGDFIVDHIDADSSSLSSHRNASSGEDNSGSI